MQTSRSDCWLSLSAINKNHPVLHFAYSQFSDLLSLSLSVCLSLTFSRPTGICSRLDFYEALSCLPSLIPVALGSAAFNPTRHGRIEFSVSGKQRTTSTPQLYLKFFFVFLREIPQTMIVTCLSKCPTRGNEGKTEGKTFEIYCSLGATILRGIRDEFLSLQYAVWNVYFANRWKPYKI